LGKSEEGTNAAPGADAAASLHIKRRGEVGELAFMRKAISLGFGVAKPWGDSDHYDFILNLGHLFWRIQVKWFWASSTYLVKSTGSNRKTYTSDEIDFLVAYINPEDLWYVLANRKAILMLPHSRNSQFERYRDAWGLLREDQEAPS